MAMRSQRYAHVLSSHPYHSAISSAPSFALGGRDDNGVAAVAGSSTLQQQDGHVGDAPAPAAEASPRLTELPRGAVSAPDRFFVSPARTASLVDAAGAGVELRGAVQVETYTSEPREEFLASMAEMATARCADGMPEAEYWEFMEELVSCYLERNDRGVHRHIFAAFADLTAGAPRRRPAKKRPLRRLMRSPCVSGR